MPRILEPIRAFSGGNSLWMIPDDPKSECYQRLNWLTHFKLTDNQLHKRPQASPWLREMMVTCDIPETEIPTGGPLLIPVAHWLPAEWLIVLPYEKSEPEKFIVSIKTVWEKFQYPSLRLFIPPTLSPKNLETLWNQYKLASEVSWVFQKT